MTKLVWLPFPAESLGDPPEGLRYETIDPTQDEIPASVADVTFYVPPYRLGPEPGDVMAAMPALEVVQTLTAGVDAVRPAVPAGVTLCNGRGIHDASTAELALTLTLASLRGIPRYVETQKAHTFTPGWRPSLADRRVLIVGYGAIGAAIEARLTPFECEVVRVARTAKDGVHPIDDLPTLLPDADVVILVVPLTDATRGLVDADFLARMKDRALLVNVARGAVVVTADLVAALHARKVTAALDVYETEPLPAESPLWDAPGLLMTPHVGGLSSAMWPRAYRLVRDQLHRYAAGEDLWNTMTGDY